MNPYRIQWAIDRTGLENCLRIRKLVFTDEQGIPQQLDHDGKDGKSAHLLVQEGHTGQSVATARFTVEQHIGLISRVAVIPEYRGKGLARVMLETIENKAKSNHLTLLALSAHADLEGYYQRFGFVTIRQAGMVSRHQLIYMEKLL